MPINRILPTRRAKAAIAAVVAGAVAVGGFMLPASTPPAVAIAVNSLIMPWEGLVLKSHWDRYAKIWDICYGETKDVTAGMVKTKAECQKMLVTRVVNDYYKPLTRCIADFDKMPISLQATLISGAYNFGVEGTPRHPGVCKSSAARLARSGDYHGACLALTAFNKAGGQIVEGLVKRREMGDAQRIGEAELCVSGLPGAA